MPAMTDAPDSPTSPSGRLLVGLAGAPDRAPRWVGELLLAVAREPGIELCRLATGNEDPAPGDASASPLLALYRRLDARVFGGTADPTTAVDLRPLLAAIPAAADGRVDVRLDLGGAAAPRDDDAPGCPTLRLRQVSLEGAPDAARPAAASDVADTLAWTPLTATALVVEAEGSAPRTVGRVVSPTDRLSARRSGRNHWPKLVRAVVRALRSLRDSGSLPAWDDAGLHPPDTRRPPATTPRVGLALARIIAGYLFRLADRTLAPETWIVAVHRRAGPPAPADPPIPDPRKETYEILRPPPGLEWADPFPVETDDGASLLFVEEWDRALGRGRLAVIPLDDGPPKAQAVLELDHHVSYPFVFRWDGTWYLLPEQAAAGALQLYRATSFPTGWTRDRTLLDAPAADATLEEIDGRWWLFAAQGDGAGTTADELHLYHAPTPLGPWTPHAANPVVTDVRTARPAGRVFRHGDHWYRPAQNGGPTYGYSVLLLRIDRLDEGGYRETLVDEVVPGWAPGVTATHTLNRAGPVTVLDARVREPRVRLRRGPRRR